MTEPRRFGKYSKVIRELEDTIKTLCQQMERIVAEKDAEIAQLKAERSSERALCEAEHQRLRVPHNGFGWTGSRCPQCGFMFFGEWEPGFPAVGQTSP